ncbi:hypothetical protein BUE60_15460 [Pseudomonas syringae pv. actinidiae]|nr:hypothetical protein BUE61_20575 [Pseudomonas syringae pv. actinidiae]PBK52611.1 hypothetical protein BUE60_15460 [Pseudomonas syringae pv. actinidiae]
MRGSRTVLREAEGETPTAYLAVVELPCSGLEHQKTADISAEEAGEAMPDAEGPLVGMRSDVDGRHSPGQ